MIYGDLSSSRIFVQSLKDYTMRKNKNCIKAETETFKYKN